MTTTADNTAGNTASVMRAVVTGCAGFIGSQLTQTLLEENCAVLGIDSFTDYYDVADKRHNIERIDAAPGRFELHTGDLCDLDLPTLLAGVDVVYHLAGQPGVRSSWGAEFAAYTHANVDATQRVLEACRSAGVPRLVYASSSSVYGASATYPTHEDMLPAPRSPYGVTKLAAEHLAVLYAANYGLGTVSLRYHTVYGPRQRPDMATHRLIRSAMTQEPFSIFGALDFVRDFTYVGDVVRATIDAGRVEVAPGTVLNIAGGSSVTMRELVAIVEDVVGAAVPIVDRGGLPGDVTRTGGDITRARHALGWSPQTTLPDGVAAQFAELRSKQAG